MLVSSQFAVFFIYAWCGCTEIKRREIGESNVGEAAAAQVASTSAEKQTKDLQRLKDEACACRLGSSMRQGTVVQAERAASAAQAESAQRAQQLKLLEEEAGSTQ